MNSFTFLKIPMLNEKDSKALMVFILGQLLLSITVFVGCILL